MNSINTAIDAASVLAHYGYTPEKAAPARGIWANDDTVLQRLSKLPELLEQHGSGKLRIVFDYDPEYPKALIQVWGLRKVNLPDKDSQPGKPEM